MNGASIPTLIRRMWYGGRKGRSANRRLAVVIKANTHTGDRFTYRVQASDDGQRWYVTLLTWRHRLDGRRRLRSVRGPQ